MVVVKMYILEKEDNAEDECIDDQDTDIWYKEEYFMNILRHLNLFHMLLWHNITNGIFW